MSSMKTAVHTPLRQSGMAGVRTGDVSRKKKQDEK